MWLQQIEFSIQFTDRFRPSRHSLQCHEPQQTPPPWPHQQSGFREPTERLHSKVWSDVFPNQSQKITTPRQALGDEDEAHLQTILDSDVLTFLNLLMQNSCNKELFLNSFLAINKAIFTQHLNALCSLALLMCLRHSPCPILHLKLPQLLPSCIHTTLTIN